MAIPRMRYNFLRSALEASGIERTYAGILDSIRDIQIPQCGGLVDVLAGCPEWDNAHGTAHTHAFLRYAWLILLFCRSFARIRCTNVSVLVMEDAVQFGGG
jgi:hypothetical protein